MKIFFIGSVSFSEKALLKIIDLNAHIVGVATKSKSNFNADHADLSLISEKNKIPWKYVKDINAPHIIEWIRSLNPDAIFCFGWSSLIKQELLFMTRIGVVGFHPTALPFNRGRHPLIWTLVLGLENSATTFFFMEEGADDGDILSQKPFCITYEDDASTVYTKIEENALIQIEAFLPKLQGGNYSRRKQDLTLGNLWRKRGIKDGKIDFRMTSTAIYNLVRALTKPYIGAHIDYYGKEVKIWKVKEEKYSLNNIEPGKVLEIKQREVLVKTYDGAIRLMQHEFVTLPSVNEYL
ncbi:formyltransferase family protein [Nonlabens marinus]|uniref:Putative transformylase n=1 Tax=Nonlabens marinus S1-08 TaxID=1454201 RepID=W8VT41_9FLAO|nr:formyltransferase family protein [Nonlabens marinus]BAO56740.1 putative transformylase [Nonlabens marinus S1-08]